MFALRHFIQLCVPKFQASDLVDLTCTRLFFHLHALIIMLAHRFPYTALSLNRDGRAERKALFTELYTIIFYIK